MCSSSTSLMADEQTLENSKTLGCVKSEVISPMDENPLPRTMEFENPSPKFGNSNEISSGSIDEVSVIEENPCKAIVVFHDTLMDFSKSSDDIVTLVTKYVDFGENLGNVGFETSVLGSCKPGETMQLGNPVSACCETAGIIGGSLEIDDAQVAKGLEEIPETMLLESPVSGCSDMGGNIGGFLEIHDAQVAKGLEEIPETMILETPVSDCHDKGGIVVRSSKIDDAYATKTVKETAQFCKTLKEFIQDGVTIAEDVQLGSTLKECNEEKEGKVEDVQRDKTVEDCNNEVGGKGEDVELGESPGLSDDDDDDEDELYEHYGYGPYDYGPYGHGPYGYGYGYGHGHGHGHGHGQGHGGGTRRSHNEKDSTFDGTVGSVEVQSPKRCDCPRCLDRDRIRKHCDCFLCSADEDVYAGDWRRMEKHRNPSGYPPNHPYYHGLMSPYNRHSAPLRGYRIDPRCRKRHFLRMRKDLEYRIYHEHRAGNRWQDYMEEDAERPFFYDPRFMERRYHFMEREHERNSHHSWGWSEPEPNPVGAGLSNLGNTCFLNAIIQCFTHTAPFVEGLFLLKHKASSHGQDEFCVLCAVRHQIERSLAFSGKTISPSNLVDNLSHISSDFRRYQQEDAHEFLLCLLDKLDSNWSEHEANAGELSSLHDSLVKQVFGGRLISQLRCCQCGHNSNSYEILNHLSLEIEDVDDLENAFSSFTKVENLQDTDKFMCSGCKEMALGEKQLLIDQAPPVVAVHLKRFKVDGFRIEKIDRIVKYPLEFDLDPYTKGTRNDDEVVKYDLYGFIVHVGLSSISGHYFCYIRTSPDTWYRFDDSKVTKVSESTALSQEAYILFYARKGTPWFGDMLEKWKTRLEEKANASPDSVLVTTNLPSNSIPLGSTLPGSNGSDETDPASATYVEPLNFLKPDEVDKESSIANANGVSSLGEPIYDEVSAKKEEVDMQVSGEEANNGCNDSSTCLNYGEDSHEVKTEKTELETCSLSNLETAVIGVPDPDDMDANPCISPEPKIPCQTEKTDMETCSLSNLETAIIGGPDPDEMDANPCISPEPKIPCQTEKTELETCSLSNLETAVIGGLDPDDMEANPCISPEPKIPEIYADDKEEQDAEQVTSQAPDHLEVQGQAPLSVKERLGKAKRDLERKVATKCVGRCQKLMVSNSLRKKKRKQSSLIHKHCRKKRVKRSSTLSSRTVAAAV